MRLLEEYYEESQTRTKARYKIVRHAMDLFPEKGIDSVTMKDIADFAGITVRNLYRYYPSKEYLVMDVAYTVFTAVDLNQEAVSNEALTGLKQLEAFMKHLYKVDQSDIMGISVMRFVMYFDLYINKLDEDHPAYRRYVDVYREEINDLGYREIARYLRRGIEDGSIGIKVGDIHTYVIFITQSLMSIIMRTIVKESENPEINGSLVLKQIDMLIHYIGN